MADLDHIKDVDNDLTYNIKDATARSDIATIQGDITTIQGDITNLQGDVTTAQGDITNLQGDVTTAQGDITTLQGDVTNLSGDLADKMDKVNPTGSGALSINRKAGTSTGPRSSTLGYNNTASGQDATAEGQESRANGAMSHAEGAGTLASGTASHAEGFAAEASGNYSHAEAQGVASGANSHAEGVATAASDFQHAGGKFNIVDSSGVYAEIIGNGSDDNNRSNARTLDWQGNETIAGDLIFNGGTSLTSGKQDTLVSGTNIKTINGASVLGSGNVVTPRPDSFQEIKSSGSSSAGTGAWHDDYSWTFPTSGLWLVQMSLTWDTNATGYRMSGINTSVAQPAAINCMRTPTNPYNQTTHNITIPINVTSTSQRYYLVSYQNSGQSLTTYPRVTILRLAS